MSTIPGRGHKRKANDGSDEDIEIEHTRALENLVEFCNAERSGWMTALKVVQRVSKLSNEYFKEEGRIEAVRRYGTTLAPRFWPEPPSVCVLINSSVRTKSESVFAVDVERFVSAVRDTKTHRLVQIQEAKAVSPPQIEKIREIGRSIGALQNIIVRAFALDKPVRRRIQISARRLPLYRSSIMVRLLEPDTRLNSVPPLRLGYEQILDFYRLSDCGAFSFGRDFKGPQFFHDVRRNVAILTATRGPMSPTDESVSSSQEEILFSEYAVSGVDAPGMNPSSISGPFTAIECVDGLGECYMRDHDAEFKLVSELCATKLSVRAPGDTNNLYCGQITLWSKKPLCASCSKVVQHQLVVALPKANIKVLVDDLESGPSLNNHNE